MLAIGILVLLLGLAIPSIQGVLSDRGLRQSVDALNALVHEAQEKSITEHRAYLLIWSAKEIQLWPEAAGPDDGAPAGRLTLRRRESYTLAFPFALEKDPPAEWIFWPSGTCEPAEVSFRGPAGTWTASYSPLTARAEITKYAPR